MRRGFRQIFVGNCFVEYYIPGGNEFNSTKVVLDLYTEMSINFSYCGLNVSGSDECSSIRQLVLRRTEHANERDIHLGWELSRMLWKLLEEVLRSNDYSDAIHRQ